MYNGILVYQAYGNLFNIGDYIQSIAARQFLPDSKQYIFINREKLNSFREEEVLLFMNGWFMHEPNNWPPNEKIIPFFISFHINSVAKEFLLSKESISYLKQWEPIGCRDRNTVRLLVANGIEAYFSGCLTLTLGMTYYNSTNDGNIYFVDPFFEFKRDIFSLLRYTIYLMMRPILIGNISKKMHKSLKLKKLIKTSAFVLIYKKLFKVSLLRSAIFITHILNESDFTSENEKFNYAEKLLTDYAKASLIITSRIHCALTCLGLQTSVLYVNNLQKSETDYCRLDGLLELFNSINYNNNILDFPELSKGEKISVNTTIKNKSNSLDLKDTLIDKCNSFLATIFE